MDVIKESTRPNYSGLTFRDLEYVVAVADHGSFISAARYCHVAQPSLSVQVRRIEERLNTIVFDRSSRGVSVTRDGRLVVEQMRRALSEGRALLALALRPDAAFHGVLRLSAIRTLAPYLFPRAMPQLRIAFPGVSFMLDEAVGGELLGALAAGDIDAALVSRPPGQQQFASRLIRRERLWMACPQDHPAANEDGPDWPQLPASERLVVDDTECLHQDAVRAAAFADVARASATVEALLYRVAAGEGCALVPALAMRTVEGVVYRSSSPTDRFRELWLAWRTNTVHAATTEELAMCLAGISP